MITIIIIIRIITIIVIIIIKIQVCCKDILLFINRAKNLSDIPLFSPNNPFNSNSLCLQLSNEELDSMKRAIKV